MNEDSKLMEMLTGYASAHQHPVNVGLHLIFIPTIMFGVFVVLGWLEIGAFGVVVNGAYIAAFILFAFYLTLDVIFSLVFLAYAIPIAWLATRVGLEPVNVSGTIAAIAFFGGYLAQFIGHAIERSVPVLLKHPVQANLAAPFFTVVEVFGMLGLRDELFKSVQARISELRQEQAA